LSQGEGMKLGQYLETPKKGVVEEKRGLTIWGGKNTKSGRGSKQTLQDERKTLGVPNSSKKNGTHKVMPGRQVWIKRGKQQEKKGNPHKKLGQTPFEAAQTMEGKVPGWAS